jgi:hypothetical protein
MEKYLFEFHEIVSNFRNDIVSKYHKFLESRIFWLLALLVIPAFFFYFNLFFLREFKSLFYFYVLLTVFVLFLLMPPIYYKFKGQDFFTLKSKYFKKNKSNSFCDQNLDLVVSSAKISQDVDRNKIGTLYSLLFESNLLDSTLVNPNVIRENGIDYFSKDYFFQIVEALTLSKHSTNCLYFTCDQKMAGYIIHEIFRPMLGMETKVLCNYFYYYKNNEFRKVNYESINATSKRKEIFKIKTRISEIIN